MSEHRTYLSKRGNPLLYVGQPLDVPVVALENYTKWYEIYLVNPNGEVQTIPSSVILDVQEKHPDAMWVDHLYHPRLLYRVAEWLNGTVDERTIEVAAGRWVIESNQFDDEVERFKFHDPAI